MLSMLKKIVPVLVVTMMIAGCAQKEATVVTYQPKLEVSDLAPGMTAPDNAYRLLSDARTSGRFACSLAIAKFEVAPSGSEARFAFKPVHTSEQAYWVETFRGMSGVSGLVFVTPFAARLDGTDAEGLCAAAQRQRAPLLLVYAPNYTGPNAAQVFGVLYDTERCVPIGTMHASSVCLNEEGQQVSPNDEKGDHRTVDARYQSQRAFEGHALSCIRDLIHGDTYPGHVEPNKWQEDVAERWWVPTRKR